MKTRILTAIFLLAITLSLAACGKASSGGAEGSSNVTGGQADPNVSVPAQSGTAVPGQITYTVDGKHIIFKVSKQISLEIDAWIGICLKGDYVYEEDADDNQFTYSFFDESRSDASDYYFKVSVEDIEDGRYSMVLCNTDNSGYVVASWDVIIKNGKPEVDYSGFKINQKPADIGETQAPAVPAEDDDDYYEETEDDGDDDAGAE